MNQDQVESLIRSILKIVGGAFVAKGFTDNSTAEIIISGIAALAGVVWSHYANKPTALS